MRHLIFVFIGLMLMSASGIAQQKNDLAILNEQLQELHNTIGTAQDKESRMAASDSTIVLLNQHWNTPGFFEYPFDRIKGLTALTSPDKQFRIFNWNVPLDKGSQHYEAFILKKAEEDQLEWIELKITKRPQSNLKNKTLRADEWYGALYYDIIEMDRGRKSYYVLLGWDGNDRLTTKKYIDVLSFTSRNEPRFGASVFKMEHGMQKRIVFEYSDEVSMSLKYYPRDNRIVYDHLSPRSSGMEGNYAFYGPDLSYDALHLKKGKWELETNVDIRQGKDNKPYIDPRPERRR